MKTFEEFWKECLEDEMFYDAEKPAAREAWEAATLAERERLKKAILTSRNFIEKNYSELHGEIGRYFAGRIDSYDEVLHVIDNP